MAINSSRKWNWTGGIEAEGRLYSKTLSEAILGLPVTSTPNQLNPRELNPNSTPMKLNPKEVNPNSTPWNSTPAKTQPLNQLNPIPLQPQTNSTPDKRIKKIYY
jgi:hypothetical protein